MRVFWPRFNFVMKILNPKKAVAFCVGVILVLGIISKLKETNHCFVNHGRNLTLLEEDTVLNIYSWEKFFKRFPHFPDDSKYCIETKVYEVKCTLFLFCFNFTKCLACFQPTFKLCTLDPNDDRISQHLHEEGYWELHIALFTKLMSEELEDILFVDVGANIGVHTLYALQLGLTVWAVEPQEKDAVKVLPL